MQARGAAPCVARALAWHVASALRRCGIAPARGVAAAAAAPPPPPPSLAARRGWGRARGAAPPPAPPRAYTSVSPGGAAGDEADAAAAAAAASAQPVPSAVAAERERAVTRAMRMVASRLKSCAEVRTRLLEEEYDDDAASFAVARLQELRLLDDAAFARTLAAHKWRTARWGAPRIAQVLAQRRVPPALARAALDQLFDEGGDAGGDDAREQLLQAARRRWHLSRGLEFEARERRLVGWLTRRGHGWRVARDVINALSAEPDP